MLALPQSPQATQQRLHICLLLLFEMLGQFRSGQALGDLHKAVVMRVSRRALAATPPKSLEAHGEFIFAFGIDSPTTGHLMHRLTWYGPYTTKLQCTLKLYPGDEGP